uniref:Uncharacterized protein LOC111102177 n=1 Tax=Crassostrea virginica TaxID=6565 RepID=A0A8B8AGS2_CRAVI|nr:uncharacterized protein LOC111102177 [Crassostrea virginica]
MDGNALKDWKRQATSEDFKREFNNKSIRIGLTETSFSNKSRFIGIQDDNESSQYYKPFDNNTQPKYKSLVLTVLVVSCLITLAVALAVLFTSSKHNPDSEIADPIVRAEGQISFNETFYPDLNNKSSHRYLKFKRKFTKAMNDVLRKVFNFRGCEISHTWEY